MVAVLFWRCKYLFARVLNPWINFFVCVLFLLCSFLFLLTSLIAFVTCAFSCSCSLCFCVNVSAGFPPSFFPLPHRSSWHLKFLCTLPLFSFVFLLLLLQSLIAFATCVFSYSCLLCFCVGVSAGFPPSFSLAPPLYLPFKHCLCNFPLFLLLFCVFPVLYFFLSAIITCYFFAACVVCVFVASWFRAFLPLSALLFLPVA